MPVTIRMLAGVLALTAVIGVAGLAQARLSQEWTWCANKRGASRDLQINGCNTVIQFGKKSNSDHAIAFNNRGIAYSAKGQHDRAILTAGPSIMISAALTIC